MSRSLKLETELLETATWCDEMAAALRSAQGGNRFKALEALRSVALKIEGRGVLLRSVVQSAGDEPTTSMSELCEFAYTVRGMMEAQRVYYAARARKEAADREIGIAKQKEAEVRGRIREIIKRATETPSFPTMVAAEGGVK